MVMPTPSLDTLDPTVSQRLPYHFAKRHGVVGARQLDDALEVWARAGVSSQVLAELQRALGQPISICELNSEEFDAVLNRAYERGANHATQIVDDIGEDMDLGAA